MNDTKKPSPEARAKAWRDIMRIVETPKWRGPVSMTPEEEEAMIFAIVEETRHEMAEEHRRARERKDEACP